LGIGDWGLGIGPNPHIFYNKFIFIKLIYLKNKDI
jgi:hypothetical protein